MPDTRSHRGAHPEDATLFGTEQWPALRQAAAELGWLLDRGYAMRSALALVGDRHNLTQRQRIGLARSACAAVDAERRAAHRVDAGALGGAEVWIDGYNLLITVEAALGGGVILRGRDGCFRDLASLHGTYRSVEETDPALLLIGESLQAWNVAQCRWIIDRPVSNSGRLKERVLSLAQLRGWCWDVDLEFSPDAILAKAPQIIVTSDSVILDRCAHWFDAGRRIVIEKIPTAFVVDLYPDSTSGFVDRVVPPP